MTASSGGGVLAVVAHPDDESLVGGTLALCARGGVETTLVCATNGAGGAGYRELGHEALAVLRRQELEAAAAVLGVAGVVFLEPPGTTPHLAQGNYGRVSESHRRQVQALIDRLRPRAVISFGPEGVTGHQTHKIVGRVTAEAVARSAHRPPLYAMAVSEAQAEAMRRWFADHPQVLDRYAEEVQRAPNIGPLVPELHAVPDDAIGDTIDVRAVAQVKHAALRCHHSQGGDGGILEVFGAWPYEHFASADPDNAGLLEQLIPRQALPTR